MGNVHCVRLLTILALMCVGLALPLRSQDPAPTGETKKSTEPAQKKQKASLEDVTRVSTRKAVQSVAKEKSKPVAEEKKTQEPAAESEITEFHPAAPEEKNPGEEPAKTKTSKKSTGKKIHGTAYGLGGGPGAPTGGGGSVGATSKSGKTSVYVESEKTKTTNPAPH